MGEVRTAPLLSVIMPAYNEESGIEAAVLEADAAVRRHVPHYEIIVVNDGSTDRTAAILEALRPEVPALCVMHTRNGGHGPALWNGLDAARGEYLFLIDSDRQIPTDAFATVWETGRHLDAAFGRRVNRQDPTYRLWLSRLIALCLRPFAGRWLPDANVPFKLLRKDVWSAARRLVPQDTLAPSLFLAVYAAHRGVRLASIDVPHRAGRGSWLPPVRLIRFCVRAAGQLAVFLWRLNRVPRGEFQRSERDLTSPVGARP